MEGIGSPEEEFHVRRDSISSFHSAQSELARSERGSTLRDDPSQGVEGKSQSRANRRSPLNTSEMSTSGTSGGKREEEKKPGVKNKPHNQKGHDEELKMVAYWELHRYADSLDYLLIFLGFLGSVAHGAVAPVNLYCFGRIVNSFGAHQDDPSFAASQVSRVAFILFIIALNSLWVTWIEVACWMQTGERQACRLRSKYVQALLYQEIGFFDTTMSVGEVISSISTDTLMFQEAIGEKVGMYLHNMGTFGAGLVVAFIACWKVALLTLVSIPLLLVTGAIYSSIYNTLVTQRHKKQLAAVSVIEQAIAQIRTVYAYVGEARAVASFVEYAEESARFGKLAGLVRGFGLGATLGIINLSWALGIWYGSFVVIKGDADGGHVVTSLLCVFFAGMALGQSTPELQVFSRGRLAASRIYKVLERVPKISSRSAGPHIVMSLKGEVQFDNVVFSYPSRPGSLIFNGLSFMVKAGEHVALVGESGSGKSSVIALIERFYDPTSGEIKVDGINIQGLNLRWWRSRIGLVGQEPALFAASIHDNIIFGNRQATRQNVEAAAQVARAHEFIKSLPNGYDTFVGENGVQLSGGQKQRIAVARAVLKNPLILLMDEATSALDVESEAAVQDGLDMLMLNRTTVTVAHRISTIQNADRILVFRHGEIVEAGTHKDLLQMGSDGVYYSLVHLQGQGLEQAKQVMSSTPRRTFLHRLEGEFVSTSMLSPGVVIGANRASGFESPSGYASPSSSLGIPSPIVSTLIGSKALKCSPRCDTLPRRSTTSSLFATPLGSPGRSPAPVSTDPKPTEMSHRGDLPTGTESDVCTFKGSSMWTSVRRNLLPEGLSFLAGTTGAIVAGALNPLFAYLMILAISDLYTNSRHEIAKQTDKISLRIMGLGVIAVLSNAIQHYNFGRAGEMTSWRLKQKSFEGLLRSEVAWFDREENASSMLTARVSSNALLVKNAVTDRLPSFVQCLTAIVVALTISFLIEWRMALVCVATFPIYMAGGSIKQGFQKTGFAGDLQLSFEKATAVAGEAVRNIRTVASFGAEDKLLASFDAQLVQHKKTIFVQSQKGGILFGISQWAMFAATALALWYASVLVKQKQATFAAVLQTFQVLAWTGFFLAEALSLIPDLAKGYTAAASMCQAIHRVSGIEPDSGKTPETVQGEVRLVNVTFHYPSRPDATVLQELSLHIAAGTTHALVGSSGSGKSTTLSLVLRFYDPIGGQVLIDGADLRTLHLRWLRQQIGWVQQEPVLFQGTIKMNILYGNDKATEAEVVAAAKLANAYSFISSMPQGFDTEVGEQGVQLSGGQKQRVAIARAVLKNPSVMLLDEATSALDTQSERIVQEALNNIMRSNRTTIVIAHRLSSVRQADKISVMDHGKVVEEGTHDSLSVAGGLYSRLCSLQEVAQ